MRSVFCAFTLVFVLVWACPVYASDGVEKVNIYVGHFLLQSWPQDKRPVTMEIDTTFPPDTLVFQAIAVKGGLKNTTLEIRDMNDAIIEEINRFTQLEDETEATFIYVLNPANVKKIKGRRFKVVLDNHQPKYGEAHNVALIFLDSK